MADTKITALAAIGANPIIPATFPIPMVDLTDTSMAASGTTKKVTVNQILGAGGTATLASAIITGDLTVDTNVLKVDTTNNRVGIGTASPSGIFHAANLGTAGSVADNFNGYFSSVNRNSNVYILAKNDQGSNLYFGDGDSNTIGAIVYEHTSNYMRFDVNGAEAARFNSTGNLVFPSAKGIDFSAVTGGTGTATANVLNDYEEGTFTPNVIGTTAAGTASYARRLGRYTKVGNLVTIQIYLSWSAGTGGLGNLAFTGLPFNIANNANEYAVATIGFLDSVALTASNIPTIIGAPNNTMLEMWQFPVGGGVSSQVPYDADGSIILTSTYVAA